jgi:hypothetical protein
LISSGVTEIQRVYDPPDYSRMPHGGFIWEAYSKESVERNLNTFFSRFPSAYFPIVEQNFPLLKDRLAPFNGATRVIVVFDVKDHYKWPSHRYVDGRMTSIRKATDRADCGFDRYDRFSAGNLALKAVGIIGLLRLFLVASLTVGVDWYLLRLTC